MATLQEIYYSFYIDLCSKTKDRVIIRNKNDQYSCLYSIAVDVLRNEKLEIQPEEIHQNIDKLICKSCWRILTEAQGGHPILFRNFQFYFVISYYTLKFSNNIPILLCSFPNSNSIFHSSMKYLTTKILYPTITG